MSETIPAGPKLRGWRIALSLTEGAAFEDVVRRQTVSYIWTALLVIATLGVAGILAGRTIRRQMRLGRLKMDLVAAVSHELKTPLSGVQLLTDSLLDEDAFEPAKTREYLQLMARENRRLSRLIENFLAFSRMEHNRYKFQFAEVHVTDIVHAAMDAIAQRSCAAAWPWMSISVPVCRLSARITMRW